MFDLAFGIKSILNIALFHKSISTFLLVKFSGGDPTRVCSRSLFLLSEERYVELAVFTNLRKVERYVEYKNTSGKYRYRVDRQR